MGDTYAAIVPYGVAPESAQAVADLFVNYLIKRKIISGKLTECVLGMDSGYPPAHHYGQILVQADDYLPELSTNGVAIQLGRQVFNAGGADEIGCPNCGNKMEAAAPENCPNCGAPVKGAKFCPECGTKIA